MTASSSIAFARAYARDLVLNAKDALEDALPQSVATGSSDVDGGLLY